MSPAFCVGAASVGPATGISLPDLDAGTDAVGRLARLGAELAVLPELFALPYVAGDDPARWRHLAESSDGPTGEWGRQSARRFGIPVLFGMALKTVSGKPLNAAVLARPDGSIEIVATKIHLPPPCPGDLHGEADHFAPGDPSVSVCEIGPIRVAILICFDRRFPESWSAAAATGADLVAVLVAGPAPLDPDGLFLAELRTHARSNAVYALAAARSGVETVLGRPVSHDGITAAIAPDGAVVAQGSGHTDDAIVVVIDPEVLAQARARNAPARRPLLGASR